MYSFRGEGQALYFFVWLLIFVAIS